MEDLDLLVDSENRISGEDKAEDKAEEKAENSSNPPVPVKRKRGRPKKNSI
jgi:hypothetical protein